MAKISYANMKLKTKDNTNIVDFNGNNIEVLQYLPIEKKYDLIMIAVQNAYEDGIYNILKLDMYFHLYLVYMYSNISFTDKQKEDELKLYDTLKSNGLLDMIISNIPEDEYTTLFRYIQDTIQAKTQHSQSFSGVISKLINDLPAQAEAAMSIVENFDKTKFQEVIDFAQAANGGRAIN